MLEGDKCCGEKYNGDGDAECGGVGTGEMADLIWEVSVSLPGKVTLRKSLKDTRNYPQGSWTGEPAVGTSQAGVRLWFLEGGRRLARL